MRGEGERDEVRRRGGESGREVLGRKGRGGEERDGVERDGVERDRVGRGGKGKKSDVAISPPHTGGI